MVGKKRIKMGSKEEKEKLTGYSYSIQKTTCRNHAPEFLFWSFFFLLLISQNTFLFYPPRVASVEKRPSFPLSIEINPSFGEGEIIKLLSTVKIYSRKKYNMLLSRKYKWSSRRSNIRYIGNERSIYFGAKFEQPFFFFRATIGSFQ